MDMTRRTIAHEHLDAQHHDTAQLQRTLDHLVGVNRWLGGTRVILKHLAACLPRRGDACVLDVGTGASDIPQAIARWAMTQRRRITVCGVDRQRQIAAIAAVRSAGDAAVRIAVADGLELPFPSGAFDIAISSMTLHHLPDDAACRFVAELSRVSRRAVIVNDLERHRINYLGARLLAATAWRRDPYTRHDGPISVLRSFNSKELLRVGEDAGLEDVRVHRHFPFRLALVGRPA